MKKILFTANLESFFSKFLIPQLKYFKENGYEVHIATKLDRNNTPFCDKSFNVDFARGFNLKQNIKSYKELKEILKNNKYDIISCHTPFGGAITRLVAKSLKLKNTRIVYMAHGFHFYEGQNKIKYALFYHAEKYLAKYTDEIITINLDDYEIARKKFKTKVSYVPGVGIDVEKFDFEMKASEKDKLRKSLGIKKNGFVMIYPAELSKNKNQILLINLMERIVKDYPNTYLLLPGNDTYNGYYQSVVKDKKLDKNVLFLGFRNDVPKLLKISDLAVASSIREGLGLNLIEARYVGLPIVAVDNRGHRDLIENGKNGYLVKNNDIDDFEDKVRLFISQKNKNLIDPKVVREGIEKYLLDNVLEQIIKIYLNK